MVIEETVLTERGRRRGRAVVIDLAAVRRELTEPCAVDCEDWARIRDRLVEATGESTFEIWLANLELAAVDVAGAMVVVAPEDTVGWVRERFGRLLADLHGHSRP